MSDFESIVEGVELEYPTDFVNYASLTDLELMLAYDSVRTQLLDLKEMINPKTREGRDLHSERAAMLVEINRRKLSRKE